MTNAELDFIIDWCRRKTAQKTSQCGYYGKKGQGYEEAMLNVMSFLHGLKPKAEEE